MKRECWGAVRITRDGDSRLSQAGALRPDTCGVISQPPCIPATMPFLL